MRVRSGWTRFIALAGKESGRTMRWGVGTVLGVLVLAGSFTAFMVGFYKPLLIVGAAGVFGLLGVGLNCFIGALSQRRWPLALAIAMVVPVVALVGAFNVYLLSYADHQGYPHPSSEVLIVGMGLLILAMPVVAWLLHRVTFRWSRHRSARGDTTESPAPPQVRLGSVNWRYRVGILLMVVAIVVLVSAFINPPPDSTDATSTAYTMWVIILGVGYWLQRRSKRG